MTVIDSPAELIAPPPRSMTAGNELERASHSRTTELVDGEPLEKTVSSDSSETELWIGTRLTVFTMSNPVARVLPATMGYQVIHNVLPGDPDRVRKPDASVIRIERVRQLPQPNPGNIPIVPDLAVEVISPDDTAREIATQLREYRLAGFPLVWVVEPEQRIVTVYPNPGKPFTLSEDDEIRAESALPGFVCRVSDLFPPALSLPEP